MLIGMFPSDKIRVCWHPSLSFPPAFLPSAQFFHHVGMLSLPPHALNLLPQSVVLKNAALKSDDARGSVAYFTAPLIASIHIAGQSSFL